MQERIALTCPVVTQQMGARSPSMGIACPAKLLVAFQETHCWRAELRTAEV